MKQEIIRQQLANGIEIAVEEMPSLRSVSLGFWVNNGARHESPSDAGLTHLIEHLLFKGSSKLSCAEIALAIDSLGGNVDAFTTREKTSYGAKVRDIHFGEAFGLLSELITQPAFRAEDIKMEKDVVLEEIRMVHDTPDDLVHEMLATAMYGDHPLGRSILGTAESVMAFSSEQIEAFYAERYNPENIIITAAGNVKASQVVAEAQKHFGQMVASGHRNQISKPVFNNISIQESKPDLEQVQFLLATETFGATDERRHALEILNTYLGGSMSSRLFQNIREQQGLAYNIHSYAHGYHDSGFLAVYAATMPERLQQLIDAVHVEFQHVANGEFEADVVDRIKSMIHTDVVLGMEGSGNRMSLLAKQLIYFGEIRTLDEVMAEFDAVTYDDVVALGKQLLGRTDFAGARLGKLNP
jgi:predicted Zn-dependent peptidase